MITCKYKCGWIAYDDKKGVLHSLNDGRREYVAVKAPIYKLSLRDESGVQELIETTDMVHTHSVYAEDGFECAYEGVGVQVVVSAKISDEIQWGIEVNVPLDKTAEWVNFPQIVVPNELKDGNGTSRILWGFNEGVEVEDLSFREKSLYYREPQYPSQGIMGIYPAIVETQFMAYYDQLSGFYFAAHDNTDCLKGIDFYRYGDGILLQFRQYCGLNPGERYVMPYPMVVKFFEGNWQDASQIYKDWFEQNKKDLFVPIGKRNDLPKWYGESPVVVTYPVRGEHDTDVMTPNKLYPYCNAMKHIERLEEELGSKIMVLLMHWEGTAPWAPPYVWPPFGGEDDLKKFIDALHARGDLLGVYCSGLGWTQQSNLIEEYNMERVFEEKNLREVMCLSPEQDLPYSAICIAQRKGYDICPTTDFAVDTMCEQVKLMADAGIDYIQLMDQNHGGTPYFCYSKKHGHPYVPGRWAVEAMQKLLNKAQETAGKALLGCESAAAESYIPYLLFSDNRFNINYRVGRPVPVYAYVFHEYVNNFMGNQVCLHYRVDYEKTPFSLLERIAYSIMAGDMLTVVLNQNGDIVWNWGQPVDMPLPEQESVKLLIKRANSWRQGWAKKYLHSGKMIKHCDVTCDSNELIYNIGGLTVPKIYTSAWSAEDGSTAQFLINYNKEDTTCVIHLPEGEYSLFENDKQHTMISGGKQQVIVKALSVYMIEKK